MADSKEVTVTYSSDIVQELLPSAECTALLFHLAYLCMANSPKLKWHLRKCAVETQLLFGSSEALLLKCTDISNKLVSLLLPQLKLAVEKNERVFTEMSLDISREWIIFIIERVEDMVHRYEKQNRNVALCTSDVIVEKFEIDKKIKQTSQETAALEYVVRDMEKELKKVTMEIGLMEEKQQLKSHDIDDSRKNNDVSMAVLLPFVGAFVKSNTQAPSNESFKLLMDKSTLRNEELTTQVKLTEMQMKLASLKMEYDTIPDPVHFTDVQICLSQIQCILVQLQKFWEWVGVLLEAIKDETFANEHLIEDSELKESFIATVDSAQEHWKTFGEICLKAKSIFCLQTKDAYNFLKNSPSSLSPEEWKKQYESVKENLRKISPEYLSVVL